jgi:nucleotide-binding universal stress UspA family protein
MFRRILLASDGSEGAAKALAAAIELARDSGELHMVCVEELSQAPTILGEVREEMRAAAHRLKPAIDKAKKLAALKQVSVVPHLVAGHPVRIIADLVQRQGFDLLVVGSSGHSEWYDRLIGSTADRLVHLAPCAVLVVK